MKMLVCGGRDYVDIEALYEFMCKVDDRHTITAVIHGGATGADSLAGRWARDRGVQEIIFPPNWDAHGRSAGYRRNFNMLHMAKPDRVIAFPGGAGTRGMVELAEKNKVPVIVLGGEIT